MLQVVGNDAFQKISPTSGLLTLGYKPGWLSDVETRQMPKAQHGKHNLGILVMYGSILLYSAFCSLKVCELVDFIGKMATMPSKRLSPIRDGI